MNNYTTLTRFVDSLTEEQLDLMAELCKVNRNEFPTKKDFIKYCVDVAWGCLDD